jgi:hypothetical protein
MENREIKTELIREGFHLWATTQKSLDNDDYIAVLDWVKFCIETGDIAFIGEISLDELVKMIWG